MNLCNCCLKTSKHKAPDCESYSCKHCNKKHSSLLHFFAKPTGNTDQPQAKNYNNRQSSAQSNQTPKKAVNLVQNYVPNESKDCISETEPQGIQPYTLFVKEHFVLLSTALIHAFDRNNQPITCRVLLDSGSQSNLITKQCVERLNLPCQKTNIPVIGISQVSTNINQKVEVKISSLFNNYSTKLSFLVLDQISESYPQVRFNISDLKIPKNIILADPNFNLPQEVDMLIGASIFYDLLSVGQIKLGKNLPVLQKSLFGYLVSGNLNLEKSNHPVTSQTMLSTIDLSKQLEKFWSIEEISSEKPTLTQEEVEVEQHFLDTTSRDETGRFIVKLPLKDNYSQLGDTRNIALRTLYSVERKLSKNPEMKDMYCSFMTEYKDLNHMTEVGSNFENDFRFYLPHHCVEKAESTTTKLRVVYNGSQKSNTNLSLNNVLKVGATVQPDLFSILLNFRQHEFALTDLAKMYRQINLHPEHRDLQRIVWRQEPSLPVKDYQLNTVTYGLASSSFHATRCLKQISDEIKDKYPVESYIIATNFYVNDLITGSNSIESLVKIKNNITKILSDYGFEIRIFKSNNLSVLSDNHKSGSAEYIISDDNCSKTLGISWFPVSDCFLYKVQLEIPEKDVVSKRTILSFISKIYDPLGFLGPIIIRAKLLIQKLWKLQLAWDESIPVQLHTLWLEYRNQLTELNTIQIPRQVLIKQAKIVQLHGFADSSESAYGCSIYLRSIDQCGNIECRLYCAKTRVAPVQAVSLPRLELQACVLLSRLTNKCLNTVSIKLEASYFWTDSTIVLAWLSREPKTWQTYICNRVSEIQQLTNISDWHHISTNENPADVLSRGCLAEEFQTNTLYWNGPSVLKQSQENWPKNSHISNFAKNSTEIPEFKNQKLIFVIQNDSTFNFEELFSKFSDFSKLIRVSSYVFRFLDHLSCKTKIKEISDKFKSKQILSKEFLETTLRIIKLIQRVEFAADFLYLTSHNEISTKSQLKALSPFVDSNEILRVDGRLLNSDLDFDGKHQILLPKNHTFTKLLVKFEHLRCLHAGINSTLSHIRQKYWIPCGKMAVKSCIRHCITCFRVKPHNINYKMGNLPAVRVKPSKVFLSVGIDYAGPFSLKDGKTKNRKIIKCYVAIFVCMATKALHIDLVTDMTTDSFLSLLKRFVSRRGLCSDIFSDNATTFVGANNEIKQLQSVVNDKVFQNYLNETQINWHFIPARSPNFGGLWESAVKSCKHYLKRILKPEFPLNFEEMYTLLVQVEAVLNSRPLIPLSPDPNDLEVLTPAHFIIGQPMTALPQRNLEDTHTNLVRRHLHVQKLVQQFWRKWSQDYLHTLQERSKWRFSKDPNLQVGSIVVLKEDNTPPASWPLGRISEVHPGSDGHVRVITIKTKHGFVKRATTRVCLLPIEADQ